MKKEDYIAQYGEEAYLEKERILAECKDQKSKDRASSRDYYHKHKEHYKEIRREYYLKNKEHLKDYSRKYYESNKSSDEWCVESRERFRKYAEEHKEVLSERMKKYNGTMRGRSKMLLHSYQRQDRLSKRGGGTTLTEQWIIDNILTKKCVYCGEDDYHKLGVRRIDKSKSYTEDNCECCCKKCNRERIK